MKIDKRIIQAIEEYNAKEIILRKETYELLNERTKKMIERSGTKVSFDNKAKSFRAIF